MSAPVLTLFEQKAAISGKKKKKKTIKNVLSIPNNFKVESFIVEINEAKKLNHILERLLSTARLPIQQNAKCRENSSLQSTNQLHLSLEAKNKRSQLSLGVNVLNRSIRKGLISVVLFACDIEPKFLIHHLCLLCDYYKIPFLHLNGLREITKNSLGFPCIAVGFKKNFSDFSEAVEEIQSIFQNKKAILSKVCLETTTENSKSEKEEIIYNEIHEDLKKNDKNPFTYLYRTSAKERIFVPEKIPFDITATKSKNDFLTLEKDDSDSESETKLSKLGISSQFTKQKGKFKKLGELESSETDDDEDLEVPKKKVKKDWIIDKTGTRRNIRYYPANLVRVPSNPDRMRKNK